MMGVAVVRPSTFHITTHTLKTWLDHDIGLSRGGMDSLGVVRAWETCHGAVGRPND